MLSLKWLTEELSYLDKMKCVVILRYFTRLHKEIMNKSPSILLDSSLKSKGKKYFRNYYSKVPPEATE